MFRVNRLHASRWGVAALMAAALLLVPDAPAQETTAGIQGSVKDPSGSAVPGATVEVTSPSLIGVRKVQTDSLGEYRLSALPPGIYAIAASAPGFRTYKQGGIDLTVGRMPSLDIKLEVGAVAETVEVSGEAPVVDVTQSKVATTVQHEVLDNLPKGRSFQTLIP